MPGGGQVGLQCVGGDGLACCQLRQHGRVRIVRGDQRAGDRRRDERSRRSRVAELRDHDRQFKQAGALAVHRLGEMKALEALLGCAPPVDRRVLHRRLQCGVQYFCRRHLLEKGSH